MSDEKEFSEETKFDTKELLVGAPQVDFSLDDILEEFGGWTKPDKKPPEKKVADRVDKDGRDEPSATIADEISAAVAAASRYSLPKKEAAVQPAAQAAQAESPNAGSPKQADAKTPAAQSEDAKTPAEQEKNSGDESAPNNITSIEAARQDARPAKKGSKRKDKAADEAPQSASEGSPEESAPQEREVQYVREAGAGEREHEPSIRELRKAMRREEKLEKKREKEEARRRAIEEKPEVSVAAAIKHYKKTAAFIRRRLATVLLLCLPLIYITMALKMDWWLPGIFSREPRALTGTMAAIALAVWILGLDVVIKGLYDLFRLRPGVETSIVLAGIGSFADAGYTLFTNAAVHGAPFCAISAMGIFFALLGNYYKKSAVERSLLATQLSDAPYEVVEDPGLWTETDCIVKIKGSTKGFVNTIEQPDAAEKTFSIFVPIILVAALAISWVSWYKSGGSFLWVYAAVMAGATPLGGMLCFAKPFSRLSKRLSISGAALAGWSGSLAVAGDCGLIITDEDLFPDGTVSLRGNNLFGGCTLEQAVTYAASLIARSGSGLTSLFASMVSQCGATFTRVENFRTLDGGLGGEIRGDMVYVGSANFIKLMGVKNIPADAGKYKFAICVSINNDLVANFIIDQEPLDAICDSLRTVVKTRRLSPVLAVRDFTTTLANVSKRFGAPSARLEFPTVEERFGLSDQARIRPARHGGIVCREGLAPYAELVVGGRWLAFVTRVNVVMSILSGVLGLVLMGFLTFTGEAAAASAANTLIFLLMWTVPVFLFSWWVKA